MSDAETVVIAHQEQRMKRAFRTWETAREWRNAAGSDYTLTEVLVHEQ